MAEKMIPICPNDHLTTPLIFTFSFKYNEFWCPRCGYLTGMFGRFREMSAAPELIEMRDGLQEKAESFLEYQASLSGAQVEDENGKLIPLVVDPVEYEYEY